MKDQHRTGSIPRSFGPRLSDVAGAAGVSRSTASRALSGARGASKEAVEAVRAASERLGYRPDLVARSLRTGSSGLGGIVVPGVSNPFFAELVEALENALRSYNLELILGDSSGLVDEEARRIETMVNRKVDGLIIIPSDHRASAAALRQAARSVAVIQVDRQVDRLAADYVGVDNAAGVRAVLEHVAQERCREVVFVSAAATSSTARGRLDGFDLGIRQVDGVKARRPLLGAFSMEFGREAARHLVDSGHLPDAIVCGADLIALGVVRELHRFKISIPRDVKVTGFDGISFSELSDPPLTTLRQPIATIAAEAARLLDARLKGDVSPARRNEIAPVLVVRRSSCESVED